MKKKRPLPLTSQYFDVGMQTEPVAIPSNSAVYETPKPRLTFGKISGDDEDDDGDYNDVFVKEDAKAFGRVYVGHISSPYILPYLYNCCRYLDTR